MKYKGLLITAAVLVWLTGGQSMGFEPPGPEERSRAIGPLEGLTAPIRLAFEPGDAFLPIPKPRPGDWLAVHPEPGQTFEEYLNARPHMPTPHRSRIYLQPLGEFPQGRSPSLNGLVSFCSAFFQLVCELREPIPIEGTHITKRINPYTHKRQVLTTDILDLLRKRMPEDAFCVLGITMEDLYPHPSWNFVFGQASLTDRVGVFSFARYHPAFYGQPCKEGSERLLLLRSCKVLAHEIGHMFHMAHCIYFHCLMNGSNHLQESDARPLHLCPVCLRKLHWAIGFDIVERYKTLEGLYVRFGFDEEAAWLQRRIEIIKDKDAPGNEKIPDII